MKKIVIVLIVIITVIAAIFWSRAVKIEKAGDEADRVLESMYELVPGLSDDSYADSGEGKDPLPAVTINGIDIIGCLKVPSLDLIVPVTAKSEARTGFAAYLDGSAVKGKLRLTGERDDVFRKIQRLRPGDKASFTDMDGVRYTYSVLTQFHLKNWDEADYDLMLCYESDDKTMFVVGLIRK